MSFDPLDSRLTAYVFDGLSEPERAAFEAELAESAEMRAAVEANRATLADLRHDLRAEPAAELTDKQRTLLAREIDSSRPTVAKKDTEYRRRVGELIAGGLLIALVGAFLLPAFQASREAAKFADISQKLSSAPAGQVLPSPREYVDPGRYSVERDSEVRSSAQAVDHLAPLINDPGPSNTVGLNAQGFTAELDYELYSHSFNAPTSQLEGWKASQGHGPGQAGDRFAPIVDNPFRPASKEPLSTFSIDVDTAAYSKVRQFLLQHNSLPRPDAVRIEELINYFPYHYAPPTDDKPFASHVAITECPWNAKHRLVRVGLKGREIKREKRPPSNLVFLLDVSGSMNEPNKLPLVKRGMTLLASQLTEQDRVAIVVYAGAAGLVLPSTTGDQRERIVGALEQLNAGGSTNGGQGIQLAYQTALDQFIAGGVNRVLLCTDGDFNVGTTGTDELVRLAETKAKSGVFLSVLGFGMGNHNDAMLEQIADKGNGNYAFIDTEHEARKVLVEQMQGTLITIAKDVKIQVEFNPREVAAYRLIGYENRVLAAQDFHDDKKDAGEIGAGHTVTALYEIVPAAANAEGLTPPIDDLKYQQSGTLTPAAGSGELLTLKLRYKQPDADTSSLLTFPVKDGGQKFGEASADVRFAASVAAFGMLLRNSPHKGTATYDGVLEMANAALGDDANGYRQEFLTVVRKAKELAGK